MTQPNNNGIFLRLEAVWWLTTAVVALLVLYPLYSAPVDFPFYTINIIYIVSFITLTRYIFLLHLTFLRRRQILKIAVICAAVPFIFYLVQGLNTFQTFLDEQGVEAIVGRLPLERQQGMITYIRGEFLLFGVGSIIAAVVLPVRLLISVWKQQNEGGRGKREVGSRKSEGEEL